jgi:fatty-acyl-CoA synthase
MYTSGTTDRPKGVMHSYANFYWKCWDHIADLPIGADDKLLTVGPLYHVGAYDCGGDTFMEPGRELDKLGSVGRTVAHVELRICDESGNPLPAGSDGEICLRGPKITRGYWRDEQKTRNSFFGDWFRTGDVGRLDDDGFLYLTDRMKDMIISGGENIASSEVERVIFAMPEVADVAVVGQPDERWGERPVAAVQLVPGASLDLERLTAYCRQHLAGFKVPRELVIVEALPRNPSGKVLKRVLRQQLAQREPSTPA